MNRALLAALLSSLAVACGGPPPAGNPSADAGATADAGDGPDAGDPDAGSPPLDPMAVWKWVPIDGSKCGRGQRAGFGLNAADGGTDLLLYFQGGGACWRTGNCVPSFAEWGPICHYGTNNSPCAWDEAGGTRPMATYVNTIDPFPADGGGAFPTEVAHLAWNRITQRSDPSNPFRDATYVFFPYCTGDLHSGDVTRTFPYQPDWLGQTTSVQIHFAGARNVQLYLEELKRRLSPSRIWVTGVSAGGYGATFHLQRVKAVFPDAEVHLLADSAPFLQPIHWTQWRDVWSMQLPAGCADCDAGMPQLARHLIETEHDSRIALLAFERDHVISYFFFGGVGLDAYLAPPYDTHQAQLDTLLPSYVDAAHAGAFVLSGTEHVMLGGYGTVQSDGGVTAPRASADGGTTLKAWIDAWATGDGSWKDATAH